MTNHVSRRSFIGGSDARIIMGDDEAALLRLWREKRGEHLWPLVDEALANKHFDTIDDLDVVVGTRCCHLHQDRSMIAQHTNFHWWPKSAVPN